MIHTDHIVQVYNIIQIATYNYEILRCHKDGSILVCMFGFIINVLCMIYIHMSAMLIYYWHVALPSIHEIINLIIFC